MIRRAQAPGASVEVTRAPRAGCQGRSKAPTGPVQAFARPSNSTMAYVRIMFRMLMHREAARWMTEANAIVLINDGKSFRARHASGTLLCFYFMEAGERRDPFGNCPETRRVVRVPLQLLMSANKAARDVYDRDGNLWTHQTPFHVIRGWTSSEKPTSPTMKTIL